MDEKWKLVRWPCRKCHHPQVEYRPLEDDFGHEDAEYLCPACHHIWRVDGSDA
jgi:DNA-directed RNA polymerase subunit M/transcription elongation factor TFIIS